MNLPGKPGRVGQFLAERYLSAATPEALATDETCFTLFDAASLELVTETSDRFWLGYRRVVSAIAIGSVGEGPMP